MDSGKVSASMNVGSWVLVYSSRFINVEVLRNGIDHMVIGSIPNNMVMIVATIVVICFLTISTCTLAACNNGDRKALLAFQSSFPGNPFWPSTGDCCSWNYVRCNKGRITYLFIDGGENVPLNGSLPASIGDITALEQLLLRFMPDLVGPIPPQLSKLKKLKWLDFAWSKLSGPLPSFLSQMPALQYVDFRNNMFLGAIPPSLGNLENLYSLALYANQLTGTIPDTLFSKAKKGNIFLFLSSNRLTGTILRSLANVDFGYFYVDDNQLTGDASFLLGKNKKMNTLSLDNNKFAFDLTNVEYPLTLTSLGISNNKIYESISNQIIELPNLIALGMSNNRLCGKIPSGGHFKNFSADTFANNSCLCGTPLPPCK